LSRPWIVPLLTIWVALSVWIAVVVAADTAFGADGDLADAGITECDQQAGVFAKERTVDGSGPRPAIG
jgi:hypothetical protein